MGYLGTKPANSPLTSELIPDGLINTSDLADNAVTTAKIAVGAVVPADLSSDVYVAKSWVSFNGSGTVAIRASGNVSSITDVGTGQYTINFTTALTDANYSVVASTTDLNSGGNSSQYVYISDTSLARTSSAFRLVSLTANGAAFFDAQHLNCVVFR